MLIEVVQDIIKTLELEWDIVQVIEAGMVIMWEVIKGRGEIIITIDGVIIGIEVMIEIGVGHMKGRVEVGEIIAV